MKISQFVTSLGALVMAILLAMPPFLPSTSAANECFSIQLRGHLSKKKAVSGGDIVKFIVEVKNGGKKDVTNLNLRVDLPAGTKYVDSVELPKSKSKITPIVLDTKIYWTALTLRKKKSLKFEVQVREIK